MAHPRAGVKIIVDRVSEIAKAIDELVGSSVMVGWPETSTDRRSEDEGPITNAALGYIHENGAPEVGIPARPSLGPGIMKAEPQVSKRFERAAQASVDGNKGEADRQLASAGQTAASSVQSVITAGIPPPLADSTIEGRLRRHPGRAGERRELEVRAATGLPGTGNVTPLIDTGQLRRAVSYAIRKALRRS